MADQQQTALVRPGEGHDALRTLQIFLNQRTKNLAMFAASRVKPDVLVRLALFEFSQNEWLRRCTPESIYGSLILAAQIGLEPSGIKGEAYLVPFKGKCTLVPGWRGLVKLALKSKAVKSIYSHVVYENDRFKVWLGSEPKVEHEPLLMGDRGELIAAYAVAKFENGEIDVEVMTLEELQKIKNAAAKSRGGKAGPAYEDWEDQMFRKAPIRRLSKRLPLGEEFHRAVKADELADVGEQERLIIDVEATEAGEFQQTQDAIAGKVAEAADKARSGA